MTTAHDKYMALYYEGRRKREAMHAAIWKVLEKLQKEYPDPEGLRLLYETFEGAAQVVLAASLVKKKEQRTVERRVADTPKKPVLPTRRGVESRKNVVDR